MSTIQLEHYFVAKCKEFKHLEIAYKYGIWSCSDRQFDPQPRKLLATAFENGPVMLVFSVKGVGWNGCARMTTAPGR